MSESAHDFTFPGIDGGDIALSNYKGKAVLVVNTASECGFTHQYADLQKLWEAYQDRGLVVLGIPSNDFGNQEPGNEREIKTFCEATYAVDFPMTSKQKVIGGNAHPFYRWIAEFAGEDAQPKWNFHKYLIGPDGALVDMFPSKVEPFDDRLIKTIEDSLPA